MTLFRLFRVHFVNPEEVRVGLSLWLWLTSDNRRGGGAAVVVLAAAVGFCPPFAADVAATLGLVLELEFPSDGATATPGSADLRPSEATRSSDRLRVTALPSAKNWSQSGFSLPLLSKVKSSCL